MIRDNMTLAEAKELVAKCQYALVYQSQGISLVPAADSLQYMEPECWQKDSNLVLRLNSAQGELYIFAVAGQVRVVYTELTEEEVVTDAYKPANWCYKAVPHCKKVLVNRVVAYDEDGQMYVQKTCFGGVEV